MRSNPHNILILGAVTLLNGLATEQTIDFQRAISPLLSDNCNSCHGPDSENREAELRLDIQSAAHESPIVPGDPKMSEFIARITNTDPEEQMPPPDSEKTLKPTDIELMRRWVSEGANHEKHWSFEPPHHHDPPQPSKTNLETNPIDAFVLDTLENTSPTASKAVNTAEPTSKAKS